MTSILYTEMHAYEDKQIDINIVDSYTIYHFSNFIARPFIFTLIARVGTFLAKKIFSKICARMHWCCIFLSTRDSIHSLNAALYTEPVDVLGHNHWVWGPRFEGMKNYRFVHFYRKPFNKILSGYRYHFDGIEEWTKKILPYEKSCSFLNSTLRQVKQNTY